MKKWRCDACGYVDRKEEVPKICPICQEDSSAFVEIVKKDKKEE